MSRKLRAHHYTDKEKYKFVTLYKLTGSLRTAATLMNISYNTAKLWHVSDWWVDMEQEVAQSARAKTNRHLVRLADLAMKEVKDRLENGDVQLDSKGKMVRIPVKAQVANRIIHDALTREEMNSRLQMDSTKLITEQSMNDRLAQIIEKFSQLGPKKIPATIIDAEIIEENAVHDQGQAGLQAGGSVGQESQGSERPVETGSPEREAPGPVHDGKARTSQEGGQPSSGPHSPAGNGWDEAPSLQARLDRESTGSPGSEERVLPA